jgi:hypothetical protein
LRMFFLNQCLKGVKNNLMKDDLSSKFNRFSGRANAKRISYGAYMLSGLTIVSMTPFEGIMTAIRGGQATEPNPTVRDIRPHLRARVARDAGAASRCIGLGS